MSGPDEPPPLWLPDQRLPLSLTASSCFLLLRAVGLSGAAFHLAPLPLDLEAGTSLGGCVTRNPIQLLVVKGNFSPSTLIGLPSHGK